MAEGGRNINMHPFNADLEDTINTGPKWDRWLKQFETRLRFFKIAEVEDKIDALNIYGGDMVVDLIEHLPDVTPPVGQDDPSAYDKVINKLNNHFKPMSNPLHAEYKFSKLVQNKTESLAQYYVRVKEAASRCEFHDPDAQIHSHILNHE